MRTQHDTGRNATAPAGEHEARPHDWTEVVAAIGTHPDLKWEPTADCYLLEHANSDMDAPEMVHPNSTTFDALMLQHCTEWLDERVVHVSTFKGLFYIDASGSGMDFASAVMLIESSYPTRIAATIAAVVAAKGGSH